MTSSVIPSETPVMIITLHTPERRSVSPLTPSPSREIRGLRLFRAISRRLTRRSAEELNFNSADMESRSSSSDSCTSEKKDESRSRDSGFRSSSPNHLSSSSSSECGSDTQVRPRHHHSTSAESVRRVFQNLNLNSRSRSCTNTKDSSKRKSSKKSAPKRILRAPVAYTYVKGLSGLPTQRIPKNRNSMYTNSPCGCNLQYMDGLNR